MASATKQREISPFFTSESLTSQEREFVLRYLETGQITPSYRAIYPERCKREDGTPFDSNHVAKKAKALFQGEKVQDYLAFVQLPQTEIARRIVNRRMLVGTDAAQFETAKGVLSREKEDARLETFEIWQSLMAECGAEVVCAVAPGEREARISMGDLVSGKAWLELPADGRVGLLEKAGFPWNLDDPDARSSPLQSELLAREERVMVLQGGTGLGKSTLGGGMALEYACLPNMRIAIVADTFDHCHDEFQYTYQGWLRLFGPRGAQRLSIVHNQKYHDMELVTPWNSYVRTISLDYKQGAAALGKQFDLIICGEASLIDEMIYWRRIKRAADRALKERSGMAGYTRRSGRIVMFTSPNWMGGAASAEWDAAEKRCGGPKGHAKLHVGAGVPWAETIYLREGNSIENPAFSREAYESARATLPPEIFAEQYQGRRMRRSGLIFKEFDRERHVIPTPPPELIRSMRLGVGTDTGKHFASYLCGLDQKLNFYVLGETYTAELKIGDNMDAVKETISDVLAVPWGVKETDPKKRYDLLKDRIDLWRVDNATQHLEDLLDEGGLDAPIERDPNNAGGKGGVVLSTIDYMRELMKNDRFFVSESCEWFLWEIERYVWAVVSNRGGTSLRTLQPRKQDDHALDAVRILCRALCELGPIVVAPPPLNFAQAYEARQRYEVFGHLKERMARAEQQRHGGRLLG